MLTSAEYQRPNVPFGAGRQVPAQLLAMHIVQYFRRADEVGRRELNI